MNTPPALAERVTTLEYAVFEQFPATVKAMAHGSNLIYEETLNNGQSITGMRVDIASLEATLHKEVADLKAAINLQGDSLRKDLGVSTAGFRSDVTGLRELMDARFRKVDGHLNGIRAEMDQRFNAVDQQFTTVRADMDQRFNAVDQRFEALDAKLDTILSELRSPTD